MPPWRTLAEIAFRTFSFALLLFALSACTPAGPKALLNGKKRIEQGRFVDAIVQLETATGLMETNAQAWNYLGLAYHHAQRSEEAAKAYQRALLLDRTLSEARYNLGCLRLEQEKLDDARAAFTAYCLDRQNSVEGHLKLGAVLVRIGDLVGAEREFQRVLSSSTNNVEALNGLGMVRIRGGRGPEAAEFLTTALKQDPTYAPALLNYGVLAHQILQDKRIAIEHYNRYLALQPTGPQAEQVRTLVQRLQNVEVTSVPQAAGPTNQVAQVKPAVVPQQGRVQSAAPKTAAVPETRTPAPETARLVPEPDAGSLPAPRGEAEKTSATQPRKGLLGKLNPMNLLSKSDASTATRSNAPQPAKTSPAAQPPASVSSGPKYKYLSPPKPSVGNTRQAELAYQQAIKAHREKKNSEALAAYRRAIQLDPAFFKAHFHLGLLCGESGDVPGAMKAYETALAIKPDSLDARYSFALLLKQQGYLVDSASQLERLVLFHPNDARGHVTLGNLYAQQFKNVPQAREHYAKALEADPNNPQASAIRHWLKQNGN